MRRILATLLLLLPLCVSAQVKLGYLSYERVLRQMPEYAQAQQNLADLKVKYEQEATRGEEEFQRKFSEFLQGQKDFPENILVKRQAELQALMETGIKFRQEAQELLTRAERELMTGVQARLNEAITAVGVEAGYAAILNTDNNSCPFINPALGEDIPEPVMRKLGLDIVTETPKNE